MTYSNAILGDLVNRDTDGDSVMDWEESLWGTDPTKRDTNDNGVSDSAEIAKMKSVAIVSNENDVPEVQNTENLTETDKFSREFFSTIATLNQNGVMDEATVEKLSTSLSEHIRNSPQRKVYGLSDIKILTNNDLNAIKTYDQTLDSIHKKYPIEGNVMSILQNFIVDEDTVNLDALAELDPIISQLNKITDALSKVNVPQSLTLLHLDFINKIQKFVENLEDIKLYEIDVIVALSGISQFEKNIILLEEATNNLAGAIKQKLNN